MASKSHSQMNEIWSSIATQIELNEQTGTTIRKALNQNDLKNRDEKQPINSKKTYHSSIAAYHQTIKIHAAWLETNIQADKFI